MNCLYFDSLDDKMDIEMLNNHPYNHPQSYEHTRRKGRNGERRFKDRERYYREQATRVQRDLYDDTQYQNNSHQMDNIIKHEIISNYGDEDEEKHVEEMDYSQPAEDLSKPAAVNCDNS